MNVTKVRDLMRLIAATSATVLATGAGAAFAQINVGGDISDTGSDSVNENTFDIENDVEVDVENNADVDTVVVGTIETGDNLVEDNTTVEDVDSGAIEVSVEAENEANSGSVDVSDLMGGMDVEADFSIEDTGSRSENVNELDVDNDVDVDIENNADIDNTLSLDLNSGNNRVRRNTTVGNVSSGDIEVNATFRNEANTGAGNVNLGGLGGGSVSVDASTSNTGSRSENRNTVDVENDVEVDVENNADIDNTVTIDSNSGNNRVEDNTTVGNVSSGNQRINLNITNRANK